MKTSTFLLLWATLVLFGLSSKDKKSKILKINTASERHPNTKRTNSNGINVIAIVSLYSTFESYPEWSLLKRFPRSIESDIIIRKPHNDLGYYDLLSYDHRSFMRILAYRHGIDGLMIHHSWHGNNSPMQGISDMIMLDGEPDIPFFFAWIKSKRLTGNTSSIQDYGNEDITSHFNYLLPFFKHKNYMKIKGRPIFVFQRIEIAYLNQLEYLIELWQELARSSGLVGIHFGRILQSRSDNNIKLDGVKSYLEVEPGFSTTPYKDTTTSTSAGNTDVKSNKAVSSRRSTQNNQGHHPVYYDQLEEWNKIENFQKNSFDITGKHTYAGTFVTWSNILMCRNETDGKYKATPRVHTGGHIKLFGKHLRRLKRNLDKIKERSINNNNNNNNNKNNIPPSYITLNAWNDWRNQAVFEPNDLDGYGALLQVKQTFKSHTEKSILHFVHSTTTTSTTSTTSTSTSGGASGTSTPGVEVIEGAEKYVKDLMGLFSEYHHYILKDGQLPDISDLLNKNVVLVHIHSVLGTGQHTSPEGLHLNVPGVGWKILDFLRDLKERLNIGNGNHPGCSIYVTVHDYQWLFPSNPQPCGYDIQRLTTTTATAATSVSGLEPASLAAISSSLPSLLHLPTLENINNTLTLFHLATTVIFPTSQLRDNYGLFLRQGRQGGAPGLTNSLDGIRMTEDKGNLSTSIVVSPPPDILLQTASEEWMDLLPYTSCSTLTCLQSPEEIHIALISDWKVVKGSAFYRMLAKGTPRIRVYRQSYTLIFHAFRLRQSNTNQFSSLQYINFHPIYSIANFKNTLSTLHIEVAIHLSLSPEVYCYSLSQSIRLGIPIVYLDTGSTDDRLHGISRAFPIGNLTLDSMQIALHRAIKWNIDKRRWLHELFSKSPSTFHKKMEAARTLEGHLSSSIQPNKWYLMNYPERY